MTFRCLGRARGGLGLAALALSALPLCADARGTPMRPAPIYSYGPRVALCVYPGGVSAPGRLVWVREAAVARHAGRGARLARGGEDECGRLPNVVLVLTDDQHPSSIDWMPNLMRRVADEGLVFTHAFVPTPVCAPSRTSLLTGQYAHRHGIHSNFDAAERLRRGGLEARALPVWLRTAGYATGYFGKYLNGYDDSRFPEVPEGWDDWRVLEGGPYFGYTLSENGQPVTYGEEEADYQTDVLLGHALRFIETHAEDPFFAVLAPYAPHAPSTPAPRHAGLLADTPPWRPPSWREQDVSDKPQWIRFQRFLQRSALPEPFDQRRIAQLESLLAVDEAVGAIPDRLAELGIDRDTVFVFTSDHGFAWGEHGWYAKWAAYEEVLRVPLLIRYPRSIRAACAVDDLVAANLDLVATFSELAGLEPLITPQQGRSLAPYLRGMRPAAPRADLLIDIWGALLTPRQRGVRTADGWKLVHSQGVDYTWDELYDLRRDPYEMENLLSSPIDPPVLFKALELEARIEELTESGAAPSRSASEQPLACRRNDGRARP